MRSLVWFRNDLRVTDHPAVWHASQLNQEVIACYFVTVEQWRSHDMGDKRLLFQLQSLQALGVELRKLGIPLKIMFADWFHELPEKIDDLCNDLRVDNVYWVDEYPLNERRRDTNVEKLLSESPVQKKYVHRFVADVVVEPGKLLSGKGTPYTVFTPFYKKWLAYVEDAGVLTHSLPRIQVHSDVLASGMDDVGVMIEDLQVRLSHEADARTSLGGEDILSPVGEIGAQNKLQKFLDAHVMDYDSARDIPALPGTSGLSACLAVGSISVAQCLHAAKQLSVVHIQAMAGAQRWISELAWRDFYRHIVAQFDHVNQGQAFRQDLDQLPWRHAPEEFNAWQHGQTGYPLVDAAMRQLNATGWMHNRLRMVAAMFLSKHLLIDWRLGEKYFMQQLIDGDFASNNGGWQWSASTGTDAVPYFRIFSPSSQGERFDKQGHFTRHWVPELVTVPTKLLFHPEKYTSANSATSQDNLFGGEVSTGLSDPIGTYPQPIVEHKFARARALAFFKANL